MSDVSLTVSSSGVRSLPCIYHLITLLLFNGGTLIYFHVLFIILYRRITVLRFIHNKY